MRNCKFTCIYICISRIHCSSSSFCVCFFSLSLSFVCVLWFDLWAISRLKPAFVCSYNRIIVIDLKKTLLLLLVALIIANIHFRQWFFNFTVDAAAAVVVAITHILVLSFASLFKFPLNKIQCCSLIAEKSYMNSLMISNSFWNYWFDCKRCCALYSVPESASFNCRQWKRERENDKERDRERIGSL